MGINLIKIYDNLPYPFKYVALNLKGYLNVKERYNQDFQQYLKKYIQLWYAKPREVETYQKAQLTLLLTEVFNHSPWYQDKMNSLGIEEVQIKNDPYQVLAKMPVLLKSERKNNVDSLLNNSRDTAMKHYTSGTSGSPTIDYVDLESINMSFAFWKRFHHIIGLKPKCRQVRLSGRLIVNPKRNRPPFWIYNYFDKQLLMSTYHLTESNLMGYIKKLNAFKPELIDGYPSAVYILSQFINQNNIRLTFKPKAIAVTAETLFNYQRKEIEQAFDCHVFNQYASNEGSPFITECTKGNLHLNIDSGIFEFHNSKGEEAEKGEVASLIVTSFINFRTPLIRYKIGDTVLLPKETVSCECGCGMPIIDELLGREDDILWTETKGYVGRMDTAYKGLSGIVRSQIIQETPKVVTVNMIVEKDFKLKTKQQFINNLKARLGERIEIRINITDNIPLGANGKFIAVQRNFEIPKFNKRD